MKHYFYYSPKESEPIGTHYCIVSRPVEMRHGHTGLICGVETETEAQCLTDILNAKEEESKRLYETLNELYMCCCDNESFINNFNIDFVEDALKQSKNNFLTVKQKV